MLFFECYSQFDLDALAKQLIVDDLRFAAQAKNLNYRNSQKQILIKCVIQEALKYAKERNLDNKQFYELCEQGIAIVWELHCSLVMDDNDFNLWKHKITLLDDLIKGKTPDFPVNRKTVEICHSGLLKPSISLRSNRAHFCRCVDSSRDVCIRK